MTRSSKLGLCVLLLAAPACVARSDYEALEARSQEQEQTLQAQAVTVRELEQREQALALLADARDQQLARVHARLELAERLYHRAQKALAAWLPRGPDGARIEPPPAKGEPTPGSLPVICLPDRPAERLPIDSAYDADSGRLFLCARLGMLTRVVELDSQTGEQLAELAQYERMGGTLALRDGRLFVSEDGAGIVTAYDLDSGAPVYEARVQGRLCASQPGGPLWFGPIEGGGAQALDPATGVPAMEVRESSYSNGLRRMTFSSDGSAMLYANTYSASVSVLHLDPPRFEQVATVNFNRRAANDAPTVSPAPHGWTIDGVRYSMALEPLDAEVKEREPMVHGRSLHPTRDLALQVRGERSTRLEAVRASTGEVLAQASLELVGPYDPSTSPRVIYDVARDRAIVQLRSYVLLVDLSQLDVPARGELRLPIAAVTALVGGDPVELPVVHGPSCLPELVSPPRGATLSDGKLRWTPSADQVGVYALRVRDRVIGDATLATVLVNVALPIYPLGFPPQWLQADPSGRHAIAWSAGVNRRDTRVAVVDLAARKILANRVLELAAQQFTVDGDDVYGLFSEPAQLIRYDANLEPQLTVAHEGIQSLRVQGPLLIGLKRQGIVALDRSTLRDVWEAPFLQLAQAYPEGDHLVIQDVALLGPQGTLREVFQPLTGLTLRGRSELPPGLRLHAHPRLSLGLALRREDGYWLDAQTFDGQPLASMRIASPIAAARELNRAVVAVGPTCALVSLQDGFAVCPLEPQLLEEAAKHPRLIARPAEPGLTLAPHDGDPVRIGVVVENAHESVTFALDAVAPGIELDPQTGTITVDPKLAWAEFLDRLKPDMRWDELQMQSALRFLGAPPTAFLAAVQLRLQVRDASRRTYYLPRTVFVVGPMADVRAKQR